MNRIPDRSTIAGTRYLDLRRAARATGRPTDELLQLYALEGFLDRMLASNHAANFVLKGGFLLLAFTERRPTRDIDLSARAISNDLTHIESVINEILATPSMMASRSTPTRPAQKRSVTKTPTLVSASQRPAHWPPPSSHSMSISTSATRFGPRRTSLHCHECLVVNRSA